MQAQIARARTARKGTDGPVSDNSVKQSAPLAPLLLGFSAKPQTRLAAILLEKANLGDFHPAVDRLAHVVHGKARDARRREGLHLDAGLAGDARRRGDMNAHAAVFALALEHRRAFHLGFRDVQRMAHRDERTRLLGRHHARHARARQNVALRSLAFHDERQRLGVHGDEALCDRNALGVRLLGHIDHADVALLVDVRQMSIATHSEFLSKNVPYARDSKRYGKLAKAVRHRSVAQPSENLAADLAHAALGAHLVMVLIGLRTKGLQEHGTLVFLGAFAQRGAQVVFHVGE